jgi:hypothetical protein
MHLWQFQTQILFTMVSSMLLIVIHLATCLGASAADVAAPRTLMPALARQTDIPHQTDMPPPEPSKTTDQTIKITPSHLLQAGYPFDLRTQSSMIVCTSR